MERRLLTREDADQLNPCRTHGTLWVRESGPNGLERVREAAKKDGKLQFTALLHGRPLGRMNIDLLRDSYHSLKKRLRLEC